ncbi:unnamed protein product [Cyclocybe aegerita]|uniref:Ubiquitin-like protease family profile domain-containing protein n=1 Tax=Cyclocybe aegerita TaxID=1973307 RepID=A0A8S0W3W5_CYCAE|nr:unnamed protein product [Cyclocybe aegerita]
MTASREDRASISMMNGLNVPGSATRGGPVWKQPPTRIDPPINFRPSAPTRPTVNNPFDIPARTNHRKSVGNQTSERTLVRASLNSYSNAEGPPQKRRKTDHLSAPDKPLRKGKTRGVRRPPLAPEPVDVEAYDDDTASHAGPSYHSRKSSASDELNLGPSANGTPSNPPRDRRSQERSRPLGIVPDGASTKELMQKYSGDVDDSIDSFTSDGSPGPPRLGHVAEMKEKFDRPVAKLDLAKEVAANKPKKSLKNTMKRKDVLGLRPMDPEPTLSSPTLVLPSAKARSKLSSVGEPLPISKIYMDGEEHHASSERRMTIQQKSLDTFAILSGKTLLRPHFNVADIDNIQCGIPSDFRSEQLMQITLKTLSQPSVMVLRFATEDPSWNSKGYDHFVSWLKGVKVRLETLLNSSVLWEVAAHDRDSNSEHSRMQQLNIVHSEKQRSGYKLGPAPGRGSGPFDETLESMSSSHRASRSSNPSSIQVSGENPANDKKRGSIRPPVANTAVRRSSRQTAQVRPTADVDQDEVILAYPQGVPGAVNITNGDLARLTPGEFLNDTLIEFGLKLWLKDLETGNEELSRQIHVFNSFFYKKLNSNKNPEQAYASVRKWTSKIDIFAKKYIIIPINERFHWYLAIIHEPGHVLRGSSTEVPPPRRQTRLSIAECSTTEASSGVDEISPTTALPVSEVVADQATSPSEAEVEDTLNDFQNSCSIEEPRSRPPTPYVLPSNENEPFKDLPSPMSDLSYVSSSKSLEFPQSPTVSNYGRNQSETLRELLSPPEQFDNMVVDIPEDDGPKETWSNADAVDPARFYQRSAKAKGKRKAEADDTPMDLDPVDGEAVVLSDHPQTRIFTFDSLGTRHPAVIKKLAQYLKMEAKDKKGVENASTATGKEAAVPVQPNYCDCGLYLVHFAQTFVGNPEHYCEVIMSQKTKSVANKERRDVWHDERVSEMRETLAERIRQLSRDWKKDRLAKEPKAPPEEGDADECVSQKEDSDVQVMPTPEGERKKKRGAKSAAFRPRG